MSNGNVNLNEPKITQQKLSLVTWIIQINITLILNFQLGLFQRFSQLC